MKKLIVLLLLAPAMTMLAQKKTNPATFAKTITADDLKKHLYFVASKEMGGRETATRGQKMAAAYIEDYFKSIGLLPGNNGSYEMNFPVLQDGAPKTTLEINGVAFKTDEDQQAFIFTSMHSDQYFSEVLFAGHGIIDSTYDDYAGLNVSGKLVLILDGAPASYKPLKVTAAARAQAKVLNAQRKGAAGVLIVGENFPRIPANVAGGMYRDLYRPSQYINSLYVSPAVAEAIIGADWTTIQNSSKDKQVAARLYKTNVHLETEKTVNRLESSNVLGLIEGTDLKDEYVFITAHYDHIGTLKDTIINYGADDDGSGTVSILELAEAFVKAKAAGKGPRRSIVFMAVSGEEKGLWGSEYYSDHPVFPLDKTTVDLNIDMIGRVGEEYLKSKDSANYVYIIGDDKISSDLAPITNQANKTLKLKLDRKYNDLNDKNRFYYRSDHYNFAKKGVPIIFYFNGVHADYHQPTDTPDKINYPLMAKRAQLVFYTAWEMANRDTMLKRDIKLDAQ
jgi:hypothetical protein